MNAPIVEGWLRSHAATRALLESMPEEALGDRYSKRTRTVAAQFAHLHYVRVLHLEKRGKEFLGDLAAFPKGAEPGKQELLRALDASADAVAAFLGAAAEAGKVKSWAAPPETFLAYLAAHEAHHRALAIVSLRLGGHKVPSEVVYGLWGHWSRKG